MTTPESAPNHSKLLDVLFLSPPRKWSSASNPPLSGSSMSSSYKDQHSPSSGVFTDADEDAAHRPGGYSSADDSSDHELDPHHILSAIENLRPYSRKPPLPPSPRSQPVSRAVSVASSVHARPFKPSKIPQLMTHSVYSSSTDSSPQRPPWRMSSSMYSPTLRHTAVLHDSTIGSCERLADVDGHETPRQPMSTSSTLRCISRIVPMPPAIVSPLCTVRMRRARTESPSMCSSFMSTTSLFSLPAYRDHSATSLMTQSLYSPTEYEMQRVEERSNVHEVDRFRNSFGGRIRCAETKMRLFAARQSKCTACRTFLPRRRHGAVNKPYVQRRDACLCRHKSRWIQRLWDDKIEPRLSPLPNPYNLSVLFGLVSLMAYFLDMLVLGLFG